MEPFRELGCKPPVSSLSPQFDAVCATSVWRKKSRKNRKKNQFWVSSFRLISHGSQGVESTRLFFSDNLPTASPRLQPFRECVMWESDCVPALFFSLYFVVFSHKQGISSSNQDISRNFTYDLQKTSWQFSSSRGVTRVSHFCNLLPLSGDFSFAKTCLKRHDCNRFALLFPD